MFGDTHSRVRRALPASMVAFTLIALGACADADTAAEDQADAAEMAADAGYDTGDDHGGSWSYAGDTGPAQWGTLSDEYATCASGTAQSPINIQMADLESADLPPLEFGYGSATLRVEDGGHGMKATPTAEQRLTIDGEVYTLQQFHVHAPSEHTVDGESYPLEVHFVHENAAGQLAVVGLMAESGEPASAFAPFVTAMSSGSDDARATTSIADLLPDDLEYVTYPGSLTTPPCSEGVRWIVLTTPVQLSAAQVATLAGGHGATNRPTQALEGRTVRLEN